VSELAVRDAESQDAPAILRVRARTWQSAYAHIFPPERLEAMSVESLAERWTAWWREIIEKPAPRSHTLVADDAGEIAGFAHLGAERDESSGHEPLGELFAIYVLPGASGRGIGQALMAEALGRLRADGFSEAILWVLEDNPRTRRFYELSGWYADGGSKDEEWLGTSVREIRYRISLAPVA
jgi:ribosomal protein S18 acetylase RimI-like enzyme